MLKIFKKILCHVTALAIMIATFGTSAVFANSQNTDYPYSITEAYFNSSGNELTVNVEYTGETTQPAKLIAASYNEKGAVTNTKILDITSSEQISFDYDKKDGESVKLYIWDSITAASPLSKTAVPTQKNDNTEDMPEGIIKLKGKVIENSITTLYGYKYIDTSEKPQVRISVTDNYGTTNSDFAELGNYYFNVGETDAESYIGLPVIFNVEKNNNEYDIVSITVDPDKNKCVEFTLDKYIGSDTDYISYLNNNATETQITIQDDADVIYNNIAGTLSYEDLFVYGLIYENFTHSGKVIAYDTDYIAGYDVIFVEVTAIGVVDNVENGKITFKNNVGSNAYANYISNIIYDEDATDVIINITKDGNKISVDEIKEWDVLSIVTNSDAYEVYNIEVLSGDNIIEGTISEAEESKSSSTGYAYTINGKVYDVIKYAYNCYNLNVDDIGIFYIDTYGKLVACNTTVKSNIHYAYVLGVSIEEDNFGNSHVQFKLLTAEHGIVIWNAADIFKIRSSDGVETIYKTEDDAYTIEAFVPVGSTILYTLSEDTIKTVTFPGYDEYGFNEVRVLSSHEYDAENLRFANRDVDDTTVILFVDEEDTDLSKVGTVADLKDCKVYEDSQLFVDNEDWNVINLIIVRNYETTPMPSIAVISSIATEQNSNGESIYNLSFMTDGEIKTAKTTSAIYSELSNITEGDIYTFTYNNSGEIEKATPYVDLADGVRIKYTDSGLAGEPEFTIADSIGNNDEIIVSPVIDYDAAKKTIYTGKKTYKLRTAANIYVIDPSLENMVSKGDFSNISFDEALINTKSDITDKDGTLLATSADVSRLLDYIIIRAHEDIVEDIVIIKAHNYGELIFGKNYEKFLDDAALAIVKSAKEKKDTNGKNIYSITYLTNGVVKTSETTAEAYNQIPNITAGDVYKFVFNDSGEIEKVRICVDFADGIKEKYDENGYASKLEYSSVTNNAESEDAIIVTPVIDYKTSTKVITVDGDSYKLSAAANVYVIDPSTDNMISTGTVADIYYDNHLVYATGDITDKNNNVIATNGDVTGLVDYVVFRTYQDRVEEVVIIKAYDYGRLQYEYIN